MRFFTVVACLLSFSCLSACVTKTINSDGTVQNNVVDKNKLSETYVDLAIEYQKHDAPQVALDRVNLAIQTLPNNARAYMIRGMIYQQLGKSSNAEDDFKKAINLKNDYSEAYVNYAVFLCEKKRYDEAATNFETALDNPLYYTPEIGYYSRGNCYYKQGNIEAANADFIKSLSYRNAPPDAYLSLAKSQFDQKNYAIANLYLSKFTGSQTPTTMWLHIQILQALIDGNIDPMRVREYSAYRNTIGQLLVTNYGNTQEAQNYLIRYGTPTSVPRGITPITASNSKNNSQMTATAMIPKHEVSHDTTGANYVYVKSGDSLYSIALKNHTTVKQLEQINKINANSIRVGMKVYLK